MSMRKRPVRKPGFFIVGAPKSGTTALLTYLCGHPNIFMPDSEPGFFGTDILSGVGVQSLQAYLRLFSRARPHHTAIGEKSVCYLYSRKAACEIRDFNPQARIIVMLRNPVDMVYSLHSELVWQKTEDITDFRKALEAEDDRRQGRKVPPNAWSAEALFYTEVPRYSEQVKRYFDAFGRSRVHVILFDDFRTATRSVYEEVLAFVGVPSDGRTDFPRVNAGKTHRMRRLKEFMSNPPGYLYRLGDIVKRILGVDHIGAWRWLHRINRRPFARPEMDARLKKQLSETFREDVQKLSELLGRDLAHWTHSGECNRAPS